jgi:hypothetical protein
MRKMFCSIPSGRVELIRRAPIFLKPYPFGWPLDLGLAVCPRRRSSTPSGAHPNPMTPILTNARWLPSSDAIAGSHPRLVVPELVHYSHPRQLLKQFSRAQSSSPILASARSSSSIPYDAPVRLLPDSKGDNSFPFPYSIEYVLDDWMLQLD